LPSSGTHQLAATGVGIGSALGNKSRHEAAISGAQARGAFCISLLVDGVPYGLQGKRIIVDREAGRQQMTTDNEQMSADISHEVRNALSCIFQFGNILIGGLAGELSEEQREYLGIMLENASRIRSALDRLNVTPAGLGERADNNGALS
jgi:signal transduction histidine kinase